MSRAHGLDKKRRQEKTKVATRASIDDQRGKSGAAGHCDCPVLLADKQQEEAPPSWKKERCCCRRYDHNRIKNSAFWLAAFSGRTEKPCG